MAPPLPSPSSLLDDVWDTPTVPQEALRHCNPDYQGSL
jgi:hypothetical protein